MRFSLLLVVVAVGCEAAPESGEPPQTCGVFQHVDDLFLHRGFVQASGTFYKDEKPFRVVRLEPVGAGEATIEQTDGLDRVGNVDLGPRHFGRVTRDTLEIYEVSDDGVPSPISVADFEETNGRRFSPTSWGAHDGALYAYAGAAFEDCAIWKVDLTDPAKPGVPFRITNRACEGGADLVQGFGGSLFLEMSHEQLFVVDLETGQEIFTAPWQGGGTDELRASVASDNNVAVFTAPELEHSIVVYPRADPPRAVEAPFGGSSSILLAVRNGIAYVSQGHNGPEYLESWNLSNPDAIAEGATHVLLQEPEGTIGGRKTTAWGISDEYIIVSGSGPGMASIFVVPLGMQGKVERFAISPPPEECVWR